MIRELELTYQEALQNYEDAKKALNDLESRYETVGRELGKAYQMYLRTQKALVKAKNALEEAK